MSLEKKFFEQDFVIEKTKLVDEDYQMKVSDQCVRLAFWRSVAR